MQKQYNIIFHVTTACNYDCSYCDVVKDKKFLSSLKKKTIISFIEQNQLSIGRCKFFGGEPLIAYKDIKDIVSNTKDFLGNNYEIVTNTSMINNDIGAYLAKYFSLIFFSIDVENSFDFSKVLDLVDKNNLESKLYFNLIVNPETYIESREQFFSLYKRGIRGFNILPVYYTKTWNIESLKGFSVMIKDILSQKVKDPSLRLYGFQENAGESTSLANNTIFIDIDGEIYYSDIVSTFLGRSLKSKLYLGNIRSCNLSLLDDFSYYDDVIKNWENSIQSKVEGQKQLSQLMDYFSFYLNSQ